MDILRLTHFCSVANHLSFTRAAEECRIAQTAMSRNIAAMEDELGFQLFRRNKHKVELTPSGALFLETAIKIVTDYSLGQQAGIDVANGRKEQLKIGYGGFEVCNIKRLLPGFIELHPDYIISIREYPYDTIADALTSRECDVIFAPNSRLVKHTQLRKIVISKIENAVALGEKHPLYEADEVLPCQLDGETFICAYDTKHSWFLQRQFEKSCETYGISPGRRIYTNSAMSLITMVELNLGIAFLTGAVDVYGNKIRIVPIKSGQQITKTTVAACNPSTDNSIADKFMDYVATNI